MARDTQAGPEVLDQLLDREAAVGDRASARVSDLLRTSLGSRAMSRTRARKAGGVGAVEGPVVEAEAEVADRVHGDGPLAAGARTATGRMLTPSVDRIATCGWLMIGAVTSVP